MTVRSWFPKLFLGAMIPALLIALSVIAASPSRTLAGAAMSYTVNVMPGSSGSAYLADGTGKPLYTYTKDVQNSGSSTVSGGLLNAWPAVSAPAGQQATLDPKAMGTLGSITRSDGSMQVTYNGWPLYTFARDTAMSAPTGDGVGGFAIATP